MMFDVSVSDSFIAQHAVTICGVEETPHEHDWQVNAIVSRNTLNEDGLVIDFLQLQKDLNDVLSILDGTNLNTNSVLGGKNPSTEIVAMYIAGELAKRVPSPARLTCIELTEAPNCIATYRL
jgi:6-pyruvoyltetrahydropterin/6-carboxytetrahydropterin synthase